MDAAAHQRLWLLACAGRCRAERQRSAEAARFARDRQIREMLTIRDLGVWTHYVGDASQPLHISIHYNGWGNYPEGKQQPRYQASPGK
jgi:hypothetical protein